MADLEFRVGRAAFPLAVCAAIIGCGAGVVEPRVAARAALTASPTFVQSNFATPQAPVLTVTIPFTAAQSAGNLNVVVVGWNDTTTSVVSVTDSAGNAYARSVGPTSNPGAITQSIYHAKNIAASAAGANVVMVSFTAPAQFADVRILEYAGIDPVNPVDTVAVGTGTAATSSTSAVSTTNASDLLFAANTVSSITTGPGTGWTSRVITSPDGDIAEDRVVTALGSYSASASLSGPGAWVMQMVAFRAAASAPPPSDTQPPTAPANLTATATSTSGIDLTWTASTDDVGVTSYLVERCQGAGCATFTQIATTASPSYSDTGLSASTSYSYRVRASDAAGNLSAYSSIASATTASPPPPAPPAAIAFVQMNFATPQTPVASVNVPFTALQSAGNLNVVVVGWNDTVAQVASVTDSKGNPYQLAVGPASQAGAVTQSIYYAKNIAAASAGANVVTVSFSAPARFPDIRVLEYAGLDPVNPVDVAVSAGGATATSSTPPVATSGAPDLLFAANTVTSWTAAAGAGWTSRVITSPDGDIAEDRTVTAAGSYGSTAPLGAAAAWVMQMVAFRAAGAAGAPPPAPDTQAPTAPSNLTATSASSSRIDLAWTASTDDVGVTSYQIERCQGAGCSTFAQIGTSPGTTFADTGLAAGTAYTYRVRASDAAGNVSAYSNVAGATTASPPPPPPPPAASANPLISRGLTSAGSAASSTPSTAINDGIYGTFEGTWIVPGTAQPAWVALRVPAGPSRVLLSWENAANFDWNLVSEPNYGAPGDYTIAISTNSTNGSDGTWTNVASVTGNLYSDREHAFAFPASGAWVRMMVTAMPNSNGVITQNAGELQISEIDIHDASSGTQDTWLFLGDSITAFWANRDNQPSFAQIIHDNHPSFFPMMINGGHGGWSSDQLVQFLPSFLAINPDVHYVAISYGTNDSAGNTADAGPFKSNLQQAITTLLNAGKVPIIPHIPFSCDGQHNNIPNFNRAIDELVAANPGTLAGPDLYTYFQAHPAELSDCIHPNATGSVSINRLWAQAMDGLYR